MGQNTTCNDSTLHLLLSSLVPPFDCTGHINDLVVTRRVTSVLTTQGFPRPSIWFRPVLYWVASGFVMA
jgi:hypothetical protein